MLDEGSNPSRTTLSGVIVVECFLESHQTASRVGAVNGWKWWNVFISASSFSMIFQKSAFLGVRFPRHSL